MSTSAISELFRPFTLYIVRHGMTMMNNDTDTSADRIRGWIDVPLVEEGREEARRAGAKLKGKDIAAIVSSDLSRARETAEIIGGIIDVIPTFTKKLRPWDLGTFAGMSTKEALPKLARYACETPDEPVPEGESFHQFKTRAFQGFYEAVTEHHGPVLIVSHHRDERILEAWDKEGQPNDHSIDLKTFLQKGDPPGGVKTLTTTKQALRGMLSHNEVGYRYAVGRDRCETCKSFEGRDDCRKVLPPIAPDGWCEVGHSAIDGHAFRDINPSSRFNEAMKFA